MTRLVFIFISLQLCIGTVGQLKRYSTANAHSHNDYLGPSPFYLAYKNGFGSIEADVFAVDDVLCVAHTKKEIQPNNTLSRLYIDPLVQAFEAGNKKKLKLLIDIKDDYRVALPLLIRDLNRLTAYLSTPEKDNHLSIIISGNRPPPSEYKNYPAFISFDSNLSIVHTAIEWQRVSLISLPFTSITKWNGGDQKLSKKDKKTLKTIIDSAHHAGKPIRFWAAPDTKTSWRWQMKLGADLIGTDKIDELSDYLN